MWTDEARRAAADARNKSEDAKVISNLRGMFGIVAGGPKGGPGTVAMNAAAAATLAQDHPKSSGFAIQSFNPKLAGAPWQTEKKVGNQTVAERIALRMRTDNMNRSGAAGRTTFRVK
jgi:hypothetical protein